MPFFWCACCQSEKPVSPPPTRVVDPREIPTETLSPTPKNHHRDSYPNSPSSLMPRLSFENSMRSNQRYMGSPSPIARHASNSKHRSFTNSQEQPRGSVSISERSMQRTSQSSHGHHQRKEIFLNGGRFKLGSRLGRGSFGVVYDGKDLQTQREVAIKMERKRQMTAFTRELTLLKDLVDCKTMPPIYWTGDYKGHRVIIMKKEGDNLSNLFEKCERRFTVKTACMIAIELITCIKEVHKWGILHRDIKPQNFLVCLENPRRICVIDFGLATRFIDPKSRRHISYRDNVSPVGTARYASLNSHMGVQQSRRDDLESLGFVFMYFLRGQLPWQGLKEEHRGRKWKRIQEVKESTSFESLCENHPKIFLIYLTTVRNLGFDETPDYSFLTGLFEKHLQENDWLDGLYDWDVLTDQPPSTLSPNVARAGYGQDQNAPNAEQEKLHNKPS